jgi:hypothetical protein
MDEVVGMGVSFKTGYNRTEINATMNMFDVNNSKKMDVLKKIIFMERVILNKLNA